MKTPLAWKNLVHNKTRTAVGIAGVGFAVILIFMQMGFKGAIRKTATQIYDALDFDLMIRSPAYLHLTEARTFPRERLYQAGALPGVERVRPFLIGLSDWQAPLRGAPLVELTEDDRRGQWRGMIVLGTDPYDAGFTRPDIRQAASLLTDSRFVIVDTKSKPEYGPAVGDTFSDADVGVETAMAKRGVRIVGLFTLGTGMACNGACMTNFDGFARVCPWQAPDLVNFGLVKLAPGVDPEEAKAALISLMGLSPGPGSEDDVEVLTRAEVNAREEHRWVVETPLGQIFSLGVWVALFVGVAIVYQVLSTDIDNMMSEYATLKAIGYDNRYLTSVVLLQSVLLALVGFVPSMAVSLGLYHLVEATSGMPMMMTWQIAATVLVLAVAMCVVSGLAALKKLFAADPADLF